MIDYFVYLISFINFFNTIIIYMNIINPISNNIITLPDVSDTIITQQIITPIQNNLQTAITNISNANTKISELQSQIDNLPNTGIGSGTTYYLTNTSNNGYYTISKTSPNGSNLTLSQTIKDVSGNVLLGQFLSDNPLNLSQIPQGIWNFSFFANDSTNNGVSLIYVEIWQYVNSSVKNLLFTMFGSDINSTVVIPYNISSTQPSFNINTTDYLLCKIYCNTTNTENTTIKLDYNSSLNYSHFNLPVVISSSHNDNLNIQGGTTGQYYHLTLQQLNNISNNASLITNGYLTNSDWTNFNNKVDLNSVQTLTNKSLTDPILTNNLIKSSTNNNINIVDVSDTLVNLNSVQTMTNKSLTDPTLINNKLLSSTNKNIAFVDVSDTLVNLNTAQTLTNKSLTDPKLTTNLIKSSTSKNIAFVDVSDTLVNLNSLQTLTNKSLTDPIIMNNKLLSFTNNNINIVDASDTLVNLNSVQTLTNKSLTNPSLTTNLLKSSTNNLINIVDVSDTLVNLNTAQTLTNKSLTDPKLINNKLLSSTGKNIVVIDSSDTLVNLNSVQTMTNKSLTDPTLINNKLLSSTGKNIVVIDSSDTLVNLSSVQTLTNKTFNNLSFTAPTLTTNIIQSSTSKFITFVDASDTLVNLNSVQTMTNKTLTAPVINSGALDTNSTAITQLTTDNTTKIATTAYVKNLLATPNSYVGTDNASVGTGLTLTASYVDIASITIPVAGTYEFNITLVGKVGRVITAILRNSTTSSDNQQSLFNMINMVGSSDVPVITSSKSVIIENITAGTIYKLRAKTDSGTTSILYSDTTNGYSSVSYKMLGLTTNVPLTKKWSSVKTATNQIFQFGPSNYLNLYFSGNYDAYVIIDPNATATTINISVQFRLENNVGNYLVADNADITKSTGKQLSNGGITNTEGRGTFGFIYDWTNNYYYRVHIMYKNSSNILFFVEQLL